MNFYHSINHLVWERTTKQPDKIVLGIPDRSLQYTKYTYKELDVAASLLARYYVDSNLLACRAKGDYTSRLVVGFLSQTGFDYAVHELAISRLGYCILLISPNNSPAAIAHLLHKVHAQSIISSDSLMSVAEVALQKLPSGLEVPKLIVQASGSVYSSSARLDNWNFSWKYPLEFEKEGDLPFVIIHSSGSTGYPKPITIGHRAGVANYSQHFGHRAFMTLPLYHNHGHSNFYRAIHAGQPLYLFPANLIPMTANNILSLLLHPECDAEAVFAVPLVIEFLAERDEGVDVLRKMKLVMFGGSALSTETGDKLVAAGVRLVGQMGTTETGQLGTSARDFENDKEWNYFRVPKRLRHYFRFEYQGDGKHELVVLDGYPTKVMSNQPDGSFRTKDLFLKNPNLEDAWKFCGRLDDTLVMVNGEKTNPVPIELTLRGESPYIADVIIFGAGRTQIGALILPSEIGKNKTPEELQLLIAPALSLANADAPKHSQLAPEALVFLPYNTTIPRADKGSPIRARTYVAFEKAIEDTYRRLEGNLNVGHAKTQIGSLKEITTLVFGYIAEVLGGKTNGLTEKTDLFSFGLDSLQTARIRNAIQRNVDLGDHKLSNNFVFENPSVLEISQYLVALDSGPQGFFMPSQIEVMLALVEKYRSFVSEMQRFKSDQNLFNKNPYEKHIVLTGATGSLGAYLLDQFLSDNHASRIYCFARATSDKKADERVAASMAHRGLLKEFKRCRDRIVCLAADFAKENLGLTVEKYEELRSNTTVIIHSAWPVNFNLGITSFEPHIAGAVNLMRLALQVRRSTPADFYFCSSVSAVFAWPGPGDVPEEITDDPGFAQQMGYARSKWIMEKLCQAASDTTCIRARVLRIGQLVGDSDRGVWNETEAISLMFKGAEILKALPVLDESPAWLPVDTAARVIFELVNAHDSAQACWNVVQPKRVPWSEILDHFQSAGMNFQRIPRREWVDRLRNSNLDPVRNPTIKLLAFFEEKYDHEDDDLPKRYALLTDRTEAASPTLRAAPYPNLQLVTKWVENWRRTGFLH